MAEYPKEIPLDAELDDLPTDPAEAAAIWQQVTSLPFSSPEAKRFALLAQAGNGS